MHNLFIENSENVQLLKATNKLHAIYVINTQYHMYVYYWSSILKDISFLRRINGTPFTKGTLLSPSNRTTRCDVYRRACKTCMATAVRRALFGEARQGETAIIAAEPPPIKPNSQRNAFVSYSVEINYLTSGLYQRAPAARSGNERDLHAKKRRSRVKASDASNGYPFYSPILCVPIACLIFFFFNDHKPNYLTPPCWITCKQPWSEKEIYIF